MQTKLISITQPLIKTEDGSRFLTAEEYIVYCARVSNPSNQLNLDTAPKLIKYLINHKHWSPMEMASATIEIKTSRAIAAQILRHRSFSFQEFSQRYSTATELEEIEWRMQGKTNRQVGDEVIELPLELQDKMFQAQHLSLKIYDELIREGIAKECARMVLPLNTSTTIYMSGTIRSWIHYIDIRAKEDTQKEHREIAYEIKDILKNHFPNISEALGW
jgi:thymidylate synthase (FAD)